MLRHPPPALILASILTAIPVAIGVGLVVFPFAHALVGSLDANTQRDILIAVGAGMGIGIGVAVRLGRRSGVPVGLLVGSLAGMVTALITIYVPGDGVAVILPPAMALSVGMLDGFGATRIRHPWDATKVSFGVAFLIGLGMSVAMSWFIFIGALMIAPIMALMTSSMPSTESGWGLRFRRPSLILGIASIVVSAALFFMVRTEGQNPPPAWVAAVLVLIFLWFIPFLFLQIGRWLAAWLRPRLDLYRQLARFVRVLWIPIGGFAIGYGSIILVFAGFYATLYHADASAFSGVPDGPVVSDWLFFSFFTALAQDYNAIMPVSNWARLLTGVQIIFCIGWAVVVFAVVMTHVQPALARIAERPED